MQELILLWCHRRLAEKVVVNEKGDHKRTDRHPPHLAGTVCGGRGDLLRSMVTGQCEILCLGTVNRGLRRPVPSRLESPYNASRGIPASGSELAASRIALESLCKAIPGSKSCPA